jgi:hypothetical protein
MHDCRRGASTWVSQGFKVSKSTTLAAVWVKIYKVGNPTNNLECRILPTTAPASRTAPRRSQRHGDRAERQAAQLRYERAVGALRVPHAAIAHRRHAVPHHAEVERRGRRRELLEVGKFKNAGKSYPHGHNSHGDATPTWTAATTGDICFLAEIAAADESVVSGGIFSTAS